MRTGQETDGATTYKLKCRNVRILSDTLVAISLEVLSPKSQFLETIESSTSMESTGSDKHMAAYAAPSLFQPHRAREAIHDAHMKKIPPLLGYYAGLSSIPITRFLAPMNFDVVWIDWEHTSCNVETMTTMVHEAIFMSQGRTIPFVRVPGHDPAAIGYALDAGASIVAPKV